MHRTQEHGWPTALGRWIVLAVALFVLQMRPAPLPLVSGQSGFLRSAAATSAPAGRRSQRGDQVESRASRAPAAARAGASVEERPSSCADHASSLPGEACSIPSTRLRELPSTSVARTASNGAPRCAQLRLPNERGPPRSA